jgi:diadenosine tetraphosphate (Ap4A) HIT family hydrolase
VVAELGASYLTAEEGVPLRGTCCVVLKRHAVELHDLSEAEGAAYMSDLRRVSAAVQAVTGAVKLNYEIHGNTIPHLHTHIYPRHRGDPFEGTSIDGRRIVSPVYAAGEFDEFVTRLRAKLGAA